MTVDLSQFYQVFFDESLEGLDAMEAELLRYSEGTQDDESINTIFRAAHSIKGGSGTFGFDSIAGFTHVLETLLDQIRDGQRDITSQHIDLFLQSIDCLREMINALSSGDDSVPESTAQLKAAFEAILNDEVADEGEQSALEAEQITTDSATQAAAIASEAHENTSGWKVTFIPSEDILMTGNEPLYLIQELTELGDHEVELVTEKIPSWSELKPEFCYLRWIVKLYCDCTEQQINEVFEWVADESEIKIEELAATESTKVAAVPALNQQDTASSEAAANEVKSSAPAVTKNADTKAATAKPATKAKQADANSIRVGIDKVDSLINMVGELVITQAMLSQLFEGEMTAQSLTRMKEGLAQLEHNTRDLQESVMRIRMLPISFVFSRFPRLVRDTGQKLGKKIELILQGESTELDKTVMEKISDPLVHLVRNAMDHGLESPEQRLAAGKPEIGKLTLNAYHQGGNVVIEIIDDGKGLDPIKIKNKAISNGLIGENDELSEEQINLLIFEAGFSTAEAVSDLSGRGVGMDVVKSNIQALNGSVDVESVVGKGATFRIRLPLTLAILDGQLIRIGQHVYIIPLVNIIESLQINQNDVSRIGGEYDVLHLRGEYVPIICLADVFLHKSDAQTLTDGLLVVVEVDGGKVGIFVDDLLAQQQVVIKSLEANYNKVEGISGATILGDGTVSLIIDIVSLVRMAGVKNISSHNLVATETHAQGGTA
ncbi:chemotaxis protein CheA [Catenovulum agarivorans]|uniref:chemotaxis protein CheA n=1 Tax=Catenovulum agarivorans TaxID=1172192 RepID=UPI00036D7487|nr:chemotaxis protein CheA [Catenovulum agarivorans]